MATATVTFEGHLPGGGRVVCGTFAIGVYLTSGVTLDLSSYLGGSPHVEASAAGYSLVHNGGTASAGKILAYCATDTNGLALTEEANATNLASVTARFMAIGKAP